MQFELLTFESPEVVMTRLEERAGDKAVTLEPMLCSTDGYSFEYVLSKATKNGAVSAHLKGVAMSCKARTQIFVNIRSDKRPKHENPRSVWTGLVDWVRSRSAKAELASDVRQMTDSLCNSD